jgi:hypothetical protein
MLTDHETKADVEAIEDVLQHQGEHDNVAILVALAKEYVPGSKEEKALLWKLDRRILVSSHTSVLIYTDS